MPYRPLSPLAAALLALALPAAADDVNIYSSRHYDTDERLYSDFTEPDRHPGQPHRRQAGGADRPDEGRGRQQPGRRLHHRRCRPHLARRPGGAAAAGPFARSSTRASRRTCATPTATGTASRSGRGSSSTPRTGSPNPPQTYDALADPDVEGPDLHPLGAQLLQPVADGGDDRQRGRRQGPRLGHRPARQPRPPAGGCRHRPAQGPGLRRMRHRRGQHLLFRPGAGRAESTASARASPTSAGSSPTRTTTGTHVNISAAGVAAHAPHPDAAIAFLEYLRRSDSAQQYFANQNYEFPAVPEVKVGATAASLGSFRSDTLNLSLLGENQAEAQRIFNEIGFP